MPTRCLMNFLIIIGKMKLGLRDEGQISNLTSIYLEINPKYIELRQ